MPRPKTRYRRNTRPAKPPTSPWTIIGWMTLGGLIVAALCALLFLGGVGVVFAKLLAG